MGSTDTNSKRSSRILRSITISMSSRAGGRCPRLTSNANSGSSSESPTCTRCPRLTSNANRDSQRIERLNRSTRSRYTHTSRESFVAHGVLLAYNEVYPMVCVCNEHKAPGRGLDQTDNVYKCTRTMRGGLASFVGARLAQRSAFSCLGGRCIFRAVQRIEPCYQPAAPADEEGPSRRRLTR